VFLRTSIFTFLLMLMLNLPFHEAEMNKEPWFELEKGLKLCGVENIFYRSSCFISVSERERVLSSGIGPLHNGLPEPPDCGWSMQPGYENEEILLQIYGGDRQECGELWQRLEAVVGRRVANSARTWSVEAYQSGDHDLTMLGVELVNALGGCLQSTHVNSRMVQLLAYLPWAGEGLPLAEGPVNLQLELYRIAGTDKVRIRLGIPVLHSMVF
jgi:hypothetical protein